MTIASLLNRFWFVVILLALLPRLSFAQSAGPRFIPQPRELHVTTEPNASQFSIAPAIDTEDRFADEDLRQDLQQRHIAVDPTHGVRIVLLRESTPEARRLLLQANLTFEPAMHDEGYIVIALPASINVIAHSSAGIFYGAQTVKQLIDAPDPRSDRGGSAKFWLGTIRDWPAMRYRGVHDDLSRGPFPTLAFQKHQIQMFASFKVNLYSPYFEHTLEYKGQLLTAPPGSALSEPEAKELAAFAAQYHMMIVPEQEAFGHLHHILKYDAYSDLAETPHGSVLAPGQPGTQQTIYRWFSQIAADFPGPFLHIGADETFDLGKGLTKDEVQKRGLGPVYADFLTQIHTTLAPLHRRLLFWGDIAGSDKAAIPGLPKDMIAIPWIYWHQDNYDNNIIPFKEAGIETWVAPGAANWSVVYPIGSTALDNIQGFVEAGQRLGSTGELLTIWNDDGEGLFNQDWFGVLFGAAAGWQSGRSDPALYQKAFGLRLFNDPTGRVDQAQQELMEAEKLIDPSDDNFWLDPWSPGAQKILARMRPKLHEGRVHAERALESLLEIQQDSPNIEERDALRAMELGARRMDFIAMKFQLSEEMADAYAKAYTLQSDPARATEVRELLFSISAMNGRCQDLRDGYSMLRDLYRDTWLSENRPYWLNNVLVRYDLRIQLWQQRGEKIIALTHDWQSKKGLPTPEDAGLPTPSGP